MCRNPGVAPEWIELLGRMGRVGWGGVLEHYAFRLLGVQRWGHIEVCNPRETGNLDVVGVVSR